MPSLVETQAVLAKATATPVVVPAKQKVAATRTVMPKTQKTTNMCNIVLKKQKGVATRAVMSITSNKKKKAATLPFVSFFGGKARVFQGRDNAGAVCGGLVQGERGAKIPCLWRRAPSHMVWVG